MFTLQACYFKALYFFKIAVKNISVQNVNKVIFLVFHCNKNVHIGDMEHNVKTNVIAMREQRFPVMKIPVNAPAERDTRVIDAIAKLESIHATRN